MKWLSALLTLTLPAPAVHRVWDLLLVCGTADVLLCAALSCLRGINPDVAARAPHLALQHTCEALYDAHPLICSTVAFLAALEEAGVPAEERQPDSQPPALPALLNEASSEDIAALVTAAQLDELRPPLSEAQLSRLVRPFSEAWEREGEGGAALWHGGHGAAAIEPTLLGEVLMELMPGLAAAPFVLSRLLAFAMGPTGDAVPLCRFLFVAGALRAGVGSDIHSALCFGFFDLAGDGVLESEELVAVLETLAFSATYQVGRANALAERSPDGVLEEEATADLVARICGPAGRLSPAEFSAVLAVECGVEASSAAASPLLFACHALQWHSLVGVGI